MGALAELSGVRMDQPDVLERFLDTSRWGALEMIMRDAKHLGKLIPTLDDVMDSIPSVASKYINQGDLDTMWARALQAVELARSSLGPVADGWQQERMAVHLFMYWIAQQIQGKIIVPAVDDKGDESGEHVLNPEIAERQPLAVQFSRNLYGYGWDFQDADLQAERKWYELMFGNLVLLQMVALQARYGLDLEKLTTSGFGKYGVCGEGLTYAACYWCGGAPCVCGGRKCGMHRKRPEYLRYMMYSLGAPEMDDAMWVCYGACRNTAKGAGHLRVMIEGGAELGFILSIDRAGGIDKLREAMGGLYLSNTQVDKMYRKYVEKGSYAHEEGRVFEGADAALSWPCLMFQQYGLSYMAGLKYAMQMMAEKANTLVEFPDADELTVPVYPSHIPQ